ncbi:MAG: hypothetical protein AAF580_12935, partial [Pseudomonadota bacterium]
MAEAETLAAIAGWWLGGNPPDAAVSIARTHPNILVTQLAVPQTVDRRVELRLSKMPLQIDPVPSPEAYARSLARSAPRSGANLVVCAGGVTEEMRNGFGEASLFLCDDDTVHDAALNWLRASAAVHDDGARQDDDNAWSTYRRDTKGVQRIVVAGPDTTAADCDVIADACLALAPDVFLDLAVERQNRVTVVALDDPIRHLGPSRTAASLRDRVIELCAAHRHSYICAPREAGPLLRSRLSKALWGRLLLVDAPARLDPGPASLIAAASGACATVDVLGYSGEAEPLADDQTSLHIAYARAQKPAADLSDVVSAAEAAGATVSALGRTKHGGLAERDRGRATTTIAMDGVSWPADRAAHRFPQEGVRQAAIDASFGGRGVSYGVYQLRPSADAPVRVALATFVSGDYEGEPGNAPWPDDANAQMDLVLDVLDGAMPELVLSRPVQLPAARGGAVDALRALVPGEAGPAGPFHDTEEEAAALRKWRRLVEDDLDQIHADRILALSAEVTGRVTVFGPDTPWDQLNVARLIGETVILADVALADVPDTVMQAGRLIVLATNPAVRTQNRAVAPSATITMVTTLPAAHRASDDDIIIDPRSVALGGGAHSSAFQVAMGLAQLLELSPVYLVGPPADLNPQEPFRALGTAADGASVARAFHGLCRQDDWVDAPRILLILGDSLPT